MSNEDLLIRRGFWRAALKWLLNLAIVLMAATCTSLLLSIPILLAEWAQ